MLFRLLNPNITVMMHLKSMYNYINTHLEDYIALLFILYLTRLLYRLIIFAIFENFFKKKFFEKIKKKKIIKYIIYKFQKERINILFFFVKPTLSVMLYKSWTYDYVNKYKYHCILIIIILINIFYNLNLSFWKKRELVELKKYMNIYKVTYYYDLRLLSTDEDEDARLMSIKNRNFYLYYLTRSYYMFSISFVAYYNSLYYFLTKNDFHKN